MFKTIMTKFKTPKVDLRELALLHHQGYTEREQASISDARIPPYMNLLTKMGANKPKTPANTFKFQQAVKTIYTHGIFISWSDEFFVP
jgi:hypothetical protein